MIDILNFIIAMVIVIAVIQLYRFVSDSLTSKKERMHKAMRSFIFEFTKQKFGMTMKEVKSSIRKIEVEFTIDWKHPLDFPDTLKAEFDENED